MTPNFNPGGSGGVYVEPPIGVWYDGGVGRWAIFYQDGRAMSAGASFNVLVPVAPIPI